MLTVIPAKAGIQVFNRLKQLSIKGATRQWIPAFAGMTVRWLAPLLNSVGWANASLAQHLVDKYRT